MPKTHRLKVHHSVVPDLVSGVKSFEFRFDDRNFEVGDTLDMYIVDDDGKELNWRPAYGMVKLVTYKLPAPAFGIPEGYCIMSIINKQ